MTKRNYISKYDFTGDSYMHQLTLARNSVVVVKQGQDISNGWLWGESQGRRGWFPVRAIDYGIEDEPSNTNDYSQFTPQQTLSSSDTAYQQQQQQAIMIESDSVTSGFDTSTNEIMGGHIPRQKAARRNEDGNPFNGQESGDKSQSSDKSKEFFSRFRKSKIIPFLHEKAKTPEWTPEPQIIYEGKVIHDFAQTKKKGFFSR